MDTTRRGFFTTAAAVTACGYAAMRDDALARVQAAVRDAGSATPEALSSDEDFWFQVQRAFDVDRSIINLNSGGVSPAPRSVMDAMSRHLAFTNEVPPRNLWTVLDPQVETVRRRLAERFGCDTEELALTRNTSEGLEICLFGLDLKPGDEVLTTTHDHFRPLRVLKQRQMRDGIVFRTLAFQTPPETLSELTALFEKNITPKTRVILCSHLTNMTGQIFPVKQIVQLARRRGIEVIVDGAQAFAHFQFTQADLGCDYYATSLHKWLCAPIGTGFLFVRKSKIANLWPLMAPAEPRSDNIRKFEHIGTHPTAPRLAIAEAINFHDGIGAARKEARLRYLRDRFARRLLGQPGVTVYTSLDTAQSCGIATIGIDGAEPRQLSDHLFARHRIVTRPIKIGHVAGVRASPNTFTTRREVDTFAEAMEHVAEHGLPS